MKSAKLSLLRSSGAPLVFVDALAQVYSDAERVSENGQDVPVHSLEHFNFWRGNSARGFSFIPHKQNLHLLVSLLNACIAAGCLTCTCSSAY